MTTLAITGVTGHSGGFVAKELSLRHVTWRVRQNVLPNWQGQL